MTVIPRSAPVVAGCAAALALLAAVVAAVGPARTERAEYAWPPPTMPAETPGRGWFTPLPLLNRVPASLELRIPCGLSAPLVGEARATVLATARRPRLTEALQVELADGSLELAVGDRRVARVPWPESCPLRAEVAGGELTLADRTIALGSDALDGMLIVTGLFTSLDLRAGEPPEVVVRTRTYATSYGVVQGLAAALAVVLALAAVVLVARSGERSRRRIASLRNAVDVTDAVVVVALVAWWIVAPVHFDDGWLWVTNHLFDDLGAVGSYFDNWGANSPLGYWLELLRHRVVGSTSDLVFARLPSLLALMGAWALCRWTLNRVVEPPVAPVVRWTLAGAFLVGATAWGMTLRQEPFVVVGAAASLAAAVSFARVPRAAPLALAGISAVLAATAHPAGIVAAAPLVAVVPRALRWLSGDRRAVLSLGTLVLATSAIALVVFTLDADLGTRLGDARVVGEGEFHGEPWWKEYLRYDRFDDSGGATAVRRLSLALLLLPVFLILTRRRVAQSAVLSLPAWSVAVGLLLLSFVASKWAAHFGALAALGAVAIAAEVARLLREGRAPGRPPVRLLLVGAVLAGVALWCWRAPGIWSSLDLQETAWNDGFGVKGYGWMVVAVVLAAVLVARALRRPGALGSAPGLATVVGWALPALSLAAVGVTIALLAVDAVRAPWTPARQNVEALAGRESCGLAHQLRGGDDLVQRMADPATASFLDPPVALYFPCATPATVAGGLVEIPGLVVHQGGLWPQELDGPMAAISDLSRLELVARGPGGIEVLAVSSGNQGYARVDAVRRR